MGANYLKCLSALCQPLTATGETPQPACEQVTAAAATAAAAAISSVTVDTHVQHGDLTFISNILLLLFDQET